MLHPQLLLAPPPLAPSPPLVLLLKPSPPLPCRAAMRVPKILMLAGDFVEDYEVWRC